MALYISAFDLQTVLQQDGEKTHKPIGATLFRRGDKAYGMFVVITGRVRLDCGVDSRFVRAYGAGALIGLPATLIHGNHSMTATVIEDAELGFWPTKELDLLLQKRPDFCRALLAILGEEMEFNRKLVRALLSHDDLPAQEVSASLA